MILCGHLPINVIGVSKLNMKYWLVLGMLVSMVALSGCGTTGGPKEDDGSAASGASSATDDTRGGSVETSGISDAGSWQGAEALNNPDSPLYNKIIYFDFDVSTIRSEYLEMLRAHAIYLLNNPSATVTVEGHCDERGSREYNIALGEQRANAVKRFFEAEGVHPSQINTVSYGEERPEDHGHSEAAWAMNRRAVLGY